MPFNRKEYMKDYLKEYGKNWRKENRERINELQRIRRAQNPEREKNYRKKYYYAHREELVQKMREKAKRFRKDNPEKIKEIDRKHSLKKEHNITTNQYKDLVDKQNGKCAICNQFETRKNNKSGLIKKLCVDHDHKTGIIRGILCDGCNQGLGSFKDSPNLLNSAKNYLENHSNFPLDERIFSL